MAAQWFELRFIESPTKVRCQCAQCGKPMWFPPSKAGKYLTCGSECHRARAATVRLARTRECLTCGQSFLPRLAQIAAGAGKYCSVRCAEPGRVAGRTAEVAAKRGAARKADIASGKLAVPRGEAHPSWRGGREAYRERQRLKDPEGRRAKRRTYLKANPGRAKEWAARRRKGMEVRLPPGTVQRIGALQRWRCAACEVSIRRGFHLDHVMPLARGGEHTPRNLQLLCAPCNLTKSAKHPVDFMRSKGRLL